MAVTESSSVSPGSSAPDFELMDVITGKPRSLEQLRGERGTAILFLGNHCPFVKHIEQGLRDLAGDYQDKGISIVAISANDAETYPQDAPQYMAQKIYPFPYLYDETQQQYVCQTFGKTLIPSVKNVSLMRERDAFRDHAEGVQQEEVLMQFGHSTKSKCLDTYCLDVQHPMSIFQACAVSLAMFDTRR